MKEGKQRVPIDFVVTSVTRLPDQDADGIRFVLAIQEGFKDVPSIGFGDTRPLNKSSRT